MSSRQTRHPLAPHVAYRTVCAVALLLACIGCIEPDNTGNSVDPNARLDSTMRGPNFRKMKNKLLPPFDRALSALIDDLDDSGMLETTLVVVCSEFGRTPKISRLEQHYKLPGRDHWGATQSMLMAGGGVAGGRVIGETDRIGAYPVDEPVTPQNLAATLYQTLGIPRSANWHDLGGRPYHVYEADPIAGLN